MNDIARELVKLAREIMAMEFDTPEAMRKYLKEHPDADRSNHHVKKQTKKQEKREDRRDKMKKEDDALTADWESKNFETMGDMRRSYRKDSREKDDHYRFIKEKINGDPATRDLWKLIEDGSDAMAKGDGKTAKGHFQKAVARIKELENTRVYSDEWFDGDDLHEGFNALELVNSNLKENMEDSEDMIKGPKQNRK